ncbi:uncharacterized protein LOC112340545 [Selaginella moellendorffii]|uniref:uncharacterized protein LOC112340545 n=1 Tax=Selaginella moellendorffii TaxID=88036 RepID=UPI000D1CB8EA|nr:uncharacterized protein LOC112340545 [Selaginella moellendorffii]XP_024514916.1 uncharacterized protein LOC112340545 [Selaginella moellendorffii]|eukprot:XP_024514915.1 uncharacterized protein LOC112340545 [Selaginella moellendorffii]
MEMDRDALHSEVSRLHRDVTGLKAVQNALKCEQKGLFCIKEKADELEEVNHTLEKCMDAVNKELARTSHDMVVFNQKMIESGLEARRNAKRFKDLEEHTAALKILIEREKSERIDLDKQLVGLEQQVKKADQELVCKATTKPKDEPLASAASKQGTAAATTATAAKGLKKAASKPPTPTPGKLDPALKPSTAPAPSRSRAATTKASSIKPAASTKVAATSTTGVSKKQRT